MSPPNGIRLVNGALDEIATANGQQIVLRGVLDPASLHLLRVDDYQREPLPLSALSKLWQALRDGESLPDIELAMRSKTFESVSGSSEFILPADKVFIIDGQQRRNAALHILSIMPDLQVRLGAMIHFGTSREWERDRFKILNLDRSKVSANVLLRNMRHQSVAILTLYGLCFNDPKFALFERVSWKQAQSANELISARTLVTAAGYLHAHRSPTFRNSLGELVPALDRQAQFVRLNQWRNNVVEFFDLIDECYGLRTITMRDMNLQTRSNFLTQIALLLSDHTNFWRGPNETELVVEPEWRKRMASFPLHDPAMAQVIAGGGGYGMRRQMTVYTFMRDHLNRGKSTNRLINREDLKEKEAAAKTFSPSIASKHDEDVDYPGRVQ